MKQLVREVLEAQCWCVLIHDNVRLHTEQHTKHKLQEFHYEVFDHPSYSPNLAPGDFHLFLHLKTLLSVQHFHSEEKVQTTVARWLHSQVSDLYDTFLQILTPLYDKCYFSGFYVEK